jgi:hypothetical protein
MSGMRISGRFGVYSGLPDAPVERGPRGCIGRQP